MYPFGLANKPVSRVAADAGECILVETQALRSVGAFANLHGALIDDCTLAAHIKRAGLKTFVGLSRAAHSHRGYQDLKPIWEMVARTAFTQLRYSFILLVSCTLIMISMFLAAPLAFLLLSAQEAYIVSALVWMAMFIPIANFNLLSAFPALESSIARNWYVVPWHDLDISATLLAWGARLLERPTL